MPKPEINEMRTPASDNNTRSQITNLISSWKPCVKTLYTKACNVQWSSTVAWPGRSGSVVNSLQLFLSQERVCLLEQFVFSPVTVQTTANPRLVSRSIHNAFSFYYVVHMCLICMFYCKISTLVFGAQLYFNMTKYFVIRQSLISRTSFIPWLSH